MYIKRVFYIIVVLALNCYNLKAQVEFSEEYVHLGISEIIKSANKPTTWYKLDRRVEIVSTLLVEHYRIPNSLDSMQNCFFVTIDDFNPKATKTFRIGPINLGSQDLGVSLGYYDFFTDLRIAAPHGARAGAVGAFKFDSLKVLKQFVLGTAAFYSGVQFNNCSFGDNYGNGYTAICSYFGNGVRFAECDFNNPTIFYQTSCDSFAMWFDKCHFNSKAIFSSFISSSPILFQNCSFKDTATFKSITAKKSLLIAGCSVKAISLLGIDVDEKEEIILRNVVSPDKKPIWLRIDNEVADNIYILNSNVELGFPGNTTEGVINSTYERLLHHLKESGQYDQYEKFDKKYKKLRYSNGGLIDQFFGLIDYYGWEYGYDRNRIIVWTGGFLLFFTLIFWGFQYPFFQRIYPIADLNDNLVSRLKKVEAGKFKRKRLRFFYALFYTSYIFFGLKVDLQKLKHVKLYQSFTILSCYFIGLLCLAFIARLIFGF